MWIKAIAISLLGSTLVAPTIASSDGRTPSKGRVNIDKTLLKEWNKLQEERKPLIEQLKKIEARLRQIEKQRDQLKDIQKQNAVPTRQRAAQYANEMTQTAIIQQQRREQENMMRDESKH